jgi:hypothetical protein
MSFSRELPDGSKKEQQNGTETETKKRKTA